MLRRIAMSAVIIGVVSLALGCLGTGATAADGRSASNRAGPTDEAAYLLDLYRHLHANPELSFHEKKTAARITKELQSVGFVVTTGVGGHGIVGILENGAGPCVMIRTDLDALPIVEVTGAAYASRVRVKDSDGQEVGVMHACGHDVHMTCFVGTARWMAANRDRWSGTLLAVGQPAEERGAGASAMLKDGLFRRFPRPTLALGLHVSPAIPAGMVGTCSGYALANVDSVDVEIFGQGGHGAYPQRCKDPVVAAARFVLAVQTLVSREISPKEPAVITVGSIHAGTKHNIIPDSVKLQLTCRSYTEEVRRQIIDGIRRTASGIAKSAGLPEEKPPVVTVLDESIPSTYNDPDLTARVRRAIEKSLGKSSVITTESVMGGEDFGLYGRAEPRIPICLFWLGAGNRTELEAAQREGRPLPSLHTATFLPVAEKTIPAGVKAMSASLIDIMGKKN